MIYSLFLLLSISFEAFSFDKDFRAVTDRAPYEFIMLLNSLKSESKKPSEQIKIVGLCKEINDNLKSLHKEQIFILIKTEIIKGILEFPFDQIRPLNINNLLITRLEENIASNEKSYTQFSKWISYSILSELNAKKDNGIITANSFSPNSFAGNQREEALRFQKYLKYLYPWMNHLLTLNGPEFNKIVNLVSLNILQRVLEKSELFKIHSNSVFGNTSETVINIPQKYLDLQPNDIKNMQQDKMPDSLSLSEKSKNERVEAEKIMDKITPLDMSTISDDVAKELEKKTAPAP